MFVIDALATPRGGRNQEPTNARARIQVLLLTSFSHVILRRFLSFALHALFIFSSPIILLFRVLSVPQARATNEKRIG